ncbi:MAG: hypothetical protein ABFQ53_03135 [Patescibacteria group bacterium]
MSNNQNLNNEKKDEAPCSSDVSFLEGLTKKTIDATHTVDNHANVMIGINTGIFIFVNSQLFVADSLHVTMGVVALFSAGSALAAVFATRLPRSLLFFKRRSHEKSVLHAQQIAQFESANVYAEKLEEMMSSEKEMIRQHALEAYNLSKYYYVPKRQMLSLSRYLFVVGVLFSSVFLLMEKLNWFVV